MFPGHLRLPAVMLTVRCGGMQLGQGEGTACP